DRVDVVSVAKYRAGHFDQLPHDGLLAAAGVRRYSTRLEKTRLGVAFHDGPLQVRPAQVETEVSRHGAYSAAGERVACGWDRDSSGSDPAGRAWNNRRT